MASIVVSEVTDIADARVRKIAVRLLREFELSAEKVACNHADPVRWPLSTDTNAFENLLAARFRTLPASLKQVSATKAMARMTAAPAVRAARFLDLSAVNLTITRAIEVQVRDLPFPIDLKLPPNYLRDLLNKPKPQPPAIPPMNQLEFRIHRVKCVDETDGFLGSEAGSDEISIGGTTVDETGDVEKAALFKVGSFGSDGSTKTLSPPKVLATFDMREAPLFPATYFVTLVLAEVDMGGISDFVNGLLNKVKERVISALTTAAGAAIGATAGPLGALVGAAIGFIVGEIFNILKTTWEDDIFKPRTVQIDIPSLSHRFAADATDSPEGTTTFSGHGGRYEVTWDWRIFA